MSPARIVLARVLGVLARVGRLLVRPAVFVVGVRLGHDVVGHWVTAAVAAPVLLVWLLWGWVVWERRLDGPPAPGGAPVPVTAPAPPRPEDQPGEHLAFAQALMAVSARYLAFCQDQTSDARRWQSRP
jgi:hypothetical protein